LLSNHEVEVSLAVRVPCQKDDSAFDAHDDEEEDDMTVDDFLSSHGFEFVDGVPAVSVHSDISADIDSHEDFSDGTFCSMHSPNAHFFSHCPGIPRLPRVIDALSTIVWPSMQPKAYNRVQSTQRRPSQAHTLLDWAGSGSADIHDEMEALERWLEDDDGGDGGASIRNDPWSAAVEKRTSESPQPQETLGVSSGRVPKNAVFGFDDDFTAYVSASPRQKSGDDGESENVNAGISVPGSYTSLGSASDFEEDRDFDRGHDLDEQSDDDEDLPTKAEIRETSARIFGSSLPSSRIRASTGSGVDITTSPISPEQEHAMASLDLGSVVTALEGMKAEIAGMTDDGERRKAAARVALGLVYGLEGK
jgi:hypothetical protein